MKLLRSIGYKELINISLSFFLFISVILTTINLYNFSSLYSEAKGKPSRGYGSCYVLPNPANLSGQYTVYGSGFKANQGLTLKITDQVGSTYLWSITDTSGAFSTISHAFNSGTVAVYIYETLSSAKRQQPLTSCQFQVI